MMEMDQWNEAAISLVNCAILGFSVSLSCWQIGQHAPGCGQFVLSFAISPLRQIVRCTTTIAAHWENVLYHYPLRMAQKDCSAIAVQVWTVTARHAEPSVTRSVIVFLGQLFTGNNS